jgi:hypothetical protein
VASLLPEDFWVNARNAVAREKPGVTWLAESVHASFIAYRRFNNLSAISDSEVYGGFDLTYDYDIFPIWQAVVTGNQPVIRYLEMLRFQDAIYPGNFAKLRYVENHDQLRIMKLAKNRNQALAWTAFQAFNRGAMLLYGGQESAETTTPSLFDIDRVRWGNYELSGFLASLARLKKHPAQLEGKFIIAHDQPAIVAYWLLPGNNLVGIFNVTGNSGRIGTSIPDGDYRDLLNDKVVTISGGEVNLPEIACILSAGGRIPQFEPLYSPLLDYHPE